MFMAWVVLLALGCSKVVGLRDGFRHKQNWKGLGKNNCYFSTRTTMASVCKTATKVQLLVASSTRMPSVLLGLGT